MILHFNEKQLIEVAEVVIRYNKYMSGQTVEGMVEWMKAMAYSTFHTKCDSYVSSGGVVLTGYHLYGDDDKPGYVYASVSSSIFKQD